MIIAYIGIKIEDPSGPVIYRNRRIGQNGKIFSLFKFRYMYWKYSTKEDYLKEGETDEAIAFEENLKQKNNGREGPLYKNEKCDLDQCWSVFRLMNYRNFLMF